MAGTQASGRPGGNPDFGIKYKATKLGEEACDVAFTLRIPKSMKDKLDKLSNKGQFCRDAINKALEEI